MRNVDGDALLTLGTQTVGEQRQVNVFIAATLADCFNVL
jgi:hypothetical protein